ncbi:Uncharacterised protein [Vibrio cholerae]|nr:Uncharacterised protein [Vibrio cholerae]
MSCAISSATCANTSSFIAAVNQPKSVLTVVFLQSKQGS